MKYFIIALCAVVAYLLGSVNSAIIISKVMYGDDIRRHGSGNAGMTNMLRTYGKGVAALTFAGDMLKCAIAMIIGWLLLGVDGMDIAGLSTNFALYPEKSADRAVFPSAMPKQLHGIWQQ